MCSAGYFSLHWWLLRWPPVLRCVAARPSSHPSGVAPSLLADHTTICPLCVCVGGEIRQRRDRIWQSLCIQLHFLGLVKGISVLWRKKRRVVTRRLDEKWVTDWSLSACDWSRNLQYNASTIRCFSYGENFKLLESLDWLEHIDSSNLGWLEIKHEKTINIT